MALSGLSQEPLSKQEEDFCVVAALLQEAPSKEEKYFKAHYEKHEYRIPMRDGVNLFTSVYELSLIHIFREITQSFYHSRPHTTVRLLQC